MLSVENINVLNNYIGHRYYSPPNETCKILYFIECNAHSAIAEFCNDFWQVFFKNNFKRINHCKFIHHKSHLKPFLSYLPYIAHREYFNIIFNVKKCTLY
jgi:hypothetical protein